MKKWIFIFLAMLMVLILPLTTAANMFENVCAVTGSAIATLTNQRDMTAANLKVRTYVIAIETECFSPNCYVKDVTKSGTLIVANDAKDPTIPRTANDLTIIMQIQIDETRLNCLTVKPSIARDDGTFMTVTLDRGAQKTKFPSSNASAVEHNIAAANVRTVGHLLRV